MTTWILIGCGLLGVAIGQALVAWVFPWIHQKWLGYKLRSAIKKERKKFPLIQVPSFTNTRRCVECGLSKDDKPMMEIDMEIPLVGKILPVTIFVCQDHVE